MHFCKQILVKTQFVVFLFIFSGPGWIWETKKKDLIRYNIMNVRK